MQVAGVDGCRAGWLVVNADASGPLRILDVFIAPTFTELVERTQDCAAVAVDIPIGLMDGEIRQADIEARRLLRPLRASSVFPSPVRAVLGANSYEEACDLSMQAIGKKLSKQSFAIVPKIREVDDQQSPRLQERVFEVHPEVCFWKLNGEQPMEQPKKTAKGAAARMALLSEAFATDISTVQLPLRKDAGLDDLYDACVAAWTAGRVAYGAAERLPPEPPRDSRGLRMEIVY